MSKNYLDYFPYQTAREEQKQAIEFGIDAFIKSKKRFVILECGTGVGKSAIGLTLSSYIQKLIPHHPSIEYEEGTYFVTTQKILQKQYETDFGHENGDMKSIYSSSNYDCKYFRSNTCKETAEMMGSMTKAENPALFKCCGGIGCTYKKAKSDFLMSAESVTNFAYFLTEATFSGKITPRKVLVIDEAHNTEAVLSNFVDISISQFFAEKIVGVKFPERITNVSFVKWVSSTYLSKLIGKTKHLEIKIDSMEGASSREIKSLVKRYQMMKSHLSKIQNFIKNYDSSNWVMEKEETEKRGYLKILYRAVDVSSYAEEYLFRLGQKVVLMSATILNAKALARSLGINEGDYETISIASPFPKENRPIMAVPIGSMSRANIDKTLPKLGNAIKEILEQHKGQKGIIHTHTYKIANYIKYSVKDKRILTHTSENRDEILALHMSSKEPTVLLSPSMTEGVDLKGVLSEFQVICKVPYPWLGDQIVKKRMNKFKGWYSLQTAKTIVQSVGRSIRSETDKAPTYILDADFGRFYSRNLEMFSADFKGLIS